MVLSEIKNVYKIYLVTNCKFVIDFFRKMVGIADITVKTFLPDESEVSDVLVILDSHIFEESSFALAKGGKDIENLRYPVLCLSGIGVSEKIRSYVEKRFRYVIPFPTQGTLFFRYFYDRIEKIHRDYPERVFLKDNGCLNMSSGIYTEISDASNKAQSPCCGKNTKSNNSLSSNDSLFGRFVGISEAICSVRKKIRKLATADVPVLLLGETGTGKSTGASIIHKLSKRNRKDMKSLNVSTIDDAIACSTFFGTTLGAFTDALDKKGFFTIADKGTLFLDEIGTASNAVQSMLLTVIESGMFRKVGGESFEKSDVRLLFATNADLGERIREGSFRKDFYCRICGNAILFPTIRSRKCDIPYIVDEHLKGKHKVLSRDAFDKLMEYDWPGNIRELHQSLDRGILYSSGETIGADDIDFGLFCI